MHLLQEANAPACSGWLAYTIKLCLIFDGNTHSALLSPPSGTALIYTVKNATFP